MFSDPQPVWRSLAPYKGHWRSQRDGDALNASPLYYLVHAQDGNSGCGEGRSVRVNVLLQVDRAGENVESFAALVDAGFDGAVVRRRETGPGLVVQLVAAARLRRGSGGRARDGRFWV